MLRLAGRSVIVLLDRARPERLGDLVRHLVREHPETDVLTEAPSLAAVAEGSTVVLCVRAIDADWLNQERPVVQARSLRLVLFSDEETTLHLARKAVDFYDWISHCIDCPPGPPEFAVRALRRAACARAPAIVWQGGDLEGTFAEALPGRTLAFVSAKQAYAELLEPLKPRAKAWMAVTDLDTTTAVHRARWAAAEAGRRGRLVLVEPTVAPASLPRAGARALAIEEGATRLQAAGVVGAVRLAALLELEPRAIDDAAKLARAGVGEAELAGLALREADPGAALGRLARERGLERALEATSANEDLNTDARGRFHLPSWPARVELAYRDGDLEVASRWAAGWRAANGGARATAALARVRLFESSIEEARALVLEASREAKQDHDEATRFEVIRAQGLTRLFDGDMGNASRLLTQALDRAKKLDRDFIDQAEIYDALIQSLIATGRLEHAEQLVREWTIKRGVRSDFLASSLLVRLIMNLKNAQGDTTAAAQTVEQWFRGRGGRDQPGAAAMEQLSAQILLQQGRFAEAESSIRQLLERYAHLGRKATPLRQQYALALQGLGRFQEAEKELRGILAGESLGSMVLVVTRHALALCLVTQGRLDEAEALLATCLTDLRRNGLVDSRTYAAVLHDEASIHLLRGDLPRAAVLLREVLRRAESSLGRENPILLETLGELSETLIRLDKPAEAEPLLRRAIRLSEQRGDLPARARALAMLAGAQAAQGFPQARDTARQSLEAWKATGSEVPPAQLRDLEAIVAGALSPRTAPSRRRG